MSRLFLSYAREDQATAKRIVEALAREGVEAWWDHQIPPGRSWDEVISGRIEDADAVIVIWSAHSVASDFVKEEAQLAFNAGKLLPVKVADVEPPVGFRRVQAANLAHWRGDSNDPQWRALVGEARARLGGAGAGKQTPLPRASVSAPQPLFGARRPMTIAIVSVSALVVVLAGGALLLNQPQPDQSTYVPAAVEAAASAPTWPSAAAVEAAAPAAEPAAEPATLSAPVSTRSVQAATVPSVAGTTWRGVVANDGQQAYTITYRFNHDGSAEWRFEDTEPFGARDFHTWRQSGNQIHFQHAEDQNYDGVIVGDVMEGYKAGLVTGTFRLVRQR